MHEREREREIKVPNTNISAAVTYAHTHTHTWKNGTKDKIKIGRVHYCSIVNHNDVVRTRRKKNWATIFTNYVMLILQEPRYDLIYR